MTVRIPVPYLLWASVIVLVLAVGASAWLLWPVSSPVETQQGLEEIPPPQVVTLEELSPEQVMRVFLQAWYRQDFATQYTFLDSSVQARVTRDAYMKRMSDQWPVISDVRIEKTRVDSLSTTETLVVVDLTITEESGVSRATPLSLSFIKSEAGWRIAEFPALPSSNDL